MNPAKVTAILEQAVAANVTGAWIETAPWRESGRGMLVASITADGTGAATVAFEGSHDRERAVSLGAALTVNQAAPAKNLAVDYPWPFVRAVVSAVAANATKLRATLAQ